MQIEIMYPVDPTDENLVIQVDIEYKTVFKSEGKFVMDGMEELIKLVYQAGKNNEDISVVKIGHY